MNDIDTLRWQISELDTQIDAVRASFRDRDNRAYAVYKKRMARLDKQNLPERARQRQVHQLQSDYYNVNAQAMATALPLINERSLLWTRLKELERLERMKDDGSQ